MEETLFKSAHEVLQSLTRHGLEAATVRKTCKYRIHKNLLDRVSQLPLAVSLPETSQAGTRNKLISCRISHRFFQLTQVLIHIGISQVTLPRACLVLLQEGFPSSLCNTKELSLDVLAIITG
ncbi:hypothetical protein Tco_0583690 [Tanacetum coccineum]